MPNGRLMLPAVLVIATLPPLPAGWLALLVSKPLASMLGSFVTWVPDTVSGMPAPIATAPEAVIVTAPPLPFWLPAVAMKELSVSEAMPVMLTEAALKPSALPYGIDMSTASALVMVKAPSDEQVQPSVDEEVARRRRAR